MNQFDSDSRPLPTGWITRQSKSRSRHYYFNTATGETSWKHPLDIDELIKTKKQLPKRSVHDDESVSSAKKSKSSKTHKLYSAVSPAKSDASKASKSSSAHSNKNLHNGQPLAQMKTGTVNANGQPHLCSNSKVGRISAWVDSVDNSYMPSEQGSCVSELLSVRSPVDGFDFFYPVDDVVVHAKSSYNGGTHTCTINTKQSKQLASKQHERGNVEKQNNNVRLVSNPSLKTRRKGSCLKVNAGKETSKSSNHSNKGDSQTGNSTPTAYTPFSPISPKPTFFGNNSVKTEMSPQLPACFINSVCQEQVYIEDVQMDSQVSHGVENEPQEAQGNQSKTVDDGEMAMDIDNYEELEDQIKLELQEIRSEFVIDPAKVSNEPEKASSISYTDTLYVVLDTNVLLSHLKLISELKDFPIEGVVRPVLVVPWIVIQELDSLKSDAWKIKKGKIITTSDKNGQCGVGALARSAVRFLHLCFENDHPRVRGQTAAEASEVLSNVSIENPSNDDRILQCCLLFQRKAEDGHAVLFSNDRNLCSKAIINGVKAFTHKSLVTGLKELFQSTAVVLKKDHFKDYYSELRIQETLAEKRAKADDIACELQCVMREGLAVVVETEMRAAYEDLWDKVVFIKPPWTLADLLQLLNKHWIAVFGHVLKRETKKTIDELRTHFGVDKGSPGCLFNTAVILEQAHALFEAITARSSFNGAATKCLTAIIVLQRKCKEYQNESSQQQPCATQSPVVMGPPQIPALVGPEAKNSSRSSSSENEPENVSERFDEASEVSSVPEINTAKAASPHALVLSTFETIWNAVTQFSAQIFSGVGFPHPVPVSVLENLPKPTKPEAIQFLGRLCTCLTCVVTALQGVLHEPKGSETGNTQLFENLLRAIAQFFEQILSMNTGVTAANLCRFARDPDTRMGLIQGCSQLDRALATLQQCSTWVVSSEQ